MDWIIAPLKSYAVFSGRTRRSEFWAFVIFVALLQLSARYFDGLSGDKPPVALGMGIAELCIFIIFVVPTVAVGVRRLHDSGRSGLWMLLGYGPLVISNLPFMADEGMAFIVIGAVLMGGGALAIMWLLPGTNGQNQHGANPRKRGM
jgi:uncharacterized membrane protein YhaH (DUF805 family)